MISGQRLDEHQEKDMSSRLIRWAGFICLTAVSACENLTPEQRTVVGIAGGAAAGLITAEALDADDDGGKMTVQKH